MWFFVRKVEGVVGEWMEVMYVGLAVVRSRPRCCGHLIPRSCLNFLNRGRARDPGMLVPASQPNIMAKDQKRPKNKRFKHET